MASWGQIRVIPMKKQSVARNLWTLRQFWELPHFLRRGTAGSVFRYILMELEAWILGLFYLNMAGRRAGWGQTLPFSVALLQPDTSALTSASLGRTDQPMWGGLVAAVHGVAKELDTI